MKRLLFPVLLLPILAFAQGGLPVNPYIYVDGKAEIQKAADLVKISFDVVARASDVAKANAEVQAKAAKVFDLLKRHKIADNDVIAESLRSEPEFENEQSYVRRGKVVGFSVSRRFDVKIRDVTAFPKLVDELIAGVNAEFSVVASGVSNEREMQDQLWEKALKNARGASRQGAQDDEHENRFGLRRIACPFSRDSHEDFWKRRTRYHYRFQYSDDRAGVSSCSGDSQPRDSRDLSDLAGEVIRCRSNE